MPRTATTKGSLAPAPVPAVTVPVAAATPATAAEPTPQPATQPVAVVEQAAATAAVAAPASEVMAVSAPTGKSEKKESKHVRRQQADAIGINIPPARVRNLLANSEINKNVNDSLDEIKECKNFGDLKEQTVAYVTKNKPDADPKKTAGGEQSLSEKLYTAFAAGDRSAAVDDASKDALSGMVRHSLLRIGDDAVTALAATANLIVEELATHGALSLASESKKTLRTYHIANDELERHRVWPFLWNLKCVKEARAAYKQRALDLAAKQAEEKMAVKEPKEPKKKKDKSAPASPTSTLVVAESPASTGSAPGAKPKREKLAEDGFKHQIKDILKKVVKAQVPTASGKGVDISDDVRTFMSHVVHEFITRYSKLIRQQTLFANVKTIKAATINSISSLLLTDAGINWPELEKYVDKCVLAYVAYSLKPKEAPPSTTPADGSAPPAAAPAKAPRKRALKKEAAPAPAAEAQVAVPATA